MTEPIRDDAAPERESEAPELHPAPEQEPAFPALPKGWPEPWPLDPEPKRSFEDGVGWTFYQPLCQWCRKRAEYVEHVHDAYLCASCTFTVAPNRPVDSETPLFLRAEPNPFVEQPEEVSHRIAFHALTLLLSAQGFEWDVDYPGKFHEREEASGSLLRNALNYVADVALKHIVASWDADLSDIETRYDDGFSFAGYEASMAEEFARLREYLTLRTMPHPFYNALRAVIRTLDAKTPEEAKQWALTAQQEATEHFYLLSDQMGDFGESARAWKPPTELPYQEVYHPGERHGGTADDISFRVAQSALYDLLHAQGGQSGFHYFSEGYPDGLVLVMEYLADLCRFGIDFDWETGTDQEHMDLIRRFLADHPGPDPFLDCLRAVDRVITAPTAKERRTAALQAMEQARRHVQRLPVIEDEDPPEDGGTSSPAPALAPSPAPASHAAAPLTEEGHSHAEPPAAAVPVRAFAAQPPQRNRRRLPDGESPDPLRSPDA